MTRTSPDNDPYNDVVRRCFENPVHAGEVGGGYARVLSAAAGSKSAGARLLLSAGIDQGTIAAMRFRAWACPHLVAAAEAACAELEGAPAGALGEFTAGHLAERLSLPCEKAGRLLLLEDVMQQLGAQYAGSNED